MSNKTWNSVHVACERYLNITRPGIDSDLVYESLTPEILRQREIDRYLYNGIKTTSNILGTKVTILTHSLRQINAGYYNSIEIEKKKHTLTLFVPTHYIHHAIDAEAIPGLTAQQYISAHNPYIDDASKRILSSTPAIEFHALQCATRALTGKLWPMPGIHCPLSIMHKDSLHSLVAYYGGIPETTFTFRGIRCTLYTIGSVFSSIKKRFMIMDYNDKLVGVSWSPLRGSSAA